MSASATKTEAVRRSKTIVNRWAKAALFTGWIPGASFALGAADMVMIRQVADAFGIAAFDEDSLKAHVGGALSSVTGAVAGEVVGMVPLIGWAVKSVALHVKADALGNAIIGYFRERSALPE